MLSSSLEMEDFSIGVLLDSRTHRDLRALGLMGSAVLMRQMCHRFAED